MPLDGTSSQALDPSSSARVDSGSSNGSQTQKVVHWHPETVFAQRAARDMDGTIAVASMILGTVGLVVSAVAVVLTTMFQPAHPAAASTSTYPHPRLTASSRTEVDRHVDIRSRKPVRQNTTSTTASSTSTSSSLPPARPKLQVLPSEETTSTLIGPTESSSGSTLVSAPESKCGCSGKRLGMLCSALCHGNSSKKDSVGKMGNTSCSTLASSSTTSTHDGEGEKKRGLRRLLSKSTTGKRRPSSLARDPSSCSSSATSSRTEEFDLAALQNDSTARGRSDKERRRRSMPTPSSVPSRSPIVLSQLLPDVSSPQAFSTPLPSPTLTPTPTPTPKHSHTLFHRPGLLSHTSSSSSSKQQKSFQSMNPTLSASLSSSTPTRPPPTPNSATSSNSASMQSSCGCRSLGSGKKARKEKPPPLRTTYTYAFAPSPAYGEGEVDELGILVHHHDHEGSKRGSSKRARTRSEYSGTAPPPSAATSQSEGQSEARKRLPSTPSPSPSRPTYSSRPTTAMPMFVPLAPRIAGSLPLDMVCAPYGQDVARVESLPKTMGEFGQVEMDVRKEKERERERGLRRLRRFSRG